MSEQKTMIELLRDIKREMPMTLELIEQQAEMLWTKYYSLKKQGFTSEQAIELCKGKIIQY